MTVESNLVTGRRDGAVLAPSRAVRDGAVWVAEGERAHKRAVRLGVQGAERSEVTAGLKPGEVVILDPPATLKEGARVKAKAGVKAS
jgi:multidrug efflux pump subunit AcrA (membrane-fusion protein)